MNKLIRIGGAAVFLTVCFYSLWALDKFQTLDKIEVDGNSVLMTVSGKTKYHVFKITNPPRIVVEFSNTEFNAKDKEITGSGDIKRIRGGQYQNDPVKLARVVIDMVKMDEYEIKRNGNDIRLVFNPPAGTKANVAVPEKASIPAVPLQEPKQPVTAQTLPAVSTVTPAPAAVVVSSKTAIPSKSVSINDESAITIAQPVPEKETSHIVIPAQKPVKTPEKATLIQPEPAASKPLLDAAAYNVKPAVKTVAAPAHKTAIQAPELGNKQVFLPRKPITIDFEDADIRDVFRMLSMKSGINIIYGNDVTGTISLRLENVPFDKAFETILALKNLVSEEQGANILRIATPQQITEERAQAVTFTKVFPLNYAKADDVKGNLDSIRNAEGRKGTISVDERTNSLIITDTPEGLVSLERIIRQLDLRPQQVIIEARIVEVNLTNDFDLGIQWQYANTLVNNSNNQVSIGATQTDANGNITPVSAAGGGTGVIFPATPVSGEIASIAFGVVSNQARITGILTALAQKGLSKLLSNPKVTTVNNKEAKILVGQRIPYTTTTVSAVGSTQATQFLDVGVKLTVTPTINVDQKITLVVHPEVSLFVRADPAGPVIGTREANTTVIVNDGETVVIGGLITDQDIKQGEQVPLLGDLPIIGHLFKHESTSKARTELLVFLTPQILEN